LCRAMDDLRASLLLRGPAHQFAVHPLRLGDGGGIVGVMPRHRAPDTTPDLFSVRPTATAPEPTSVSENKIPANALVSPPRFLLPKNLAGALKRLDDAEFDTLLVAVNIEAERRGRLPPSRVKPMPQPRQVRVEDGADSLTTGKLNAVRAAFKAGVKPSAIARQFGISQSDVRKALARPRG
jgi:hypothetical protein